jgi:quaternary ammonium compound-resistance protein SugE
MAELFVYAFFGSMAIIPGTMKLPWLYLLIAGLSEVGWTYYLKKSEGLTQLFPSLGFLILLGLSMGLLSLSIRDIPIGVAYPVWTGIGAAGAVFVGSLFFAEPFGLLKGLFLVMIITGILGLKFLVS